MKIDWKRKLTSRKFWALIAGFVAGIIIYATSPVKSPEAVSGIIMSLGSVVAYIIGEGLADSGGSTTTDTSADLMPGVEKEFGIGFKNDSGSDDRCK